MDKAEKIVEEIIDDLAGNPICTMYNWDTTMWKAFYERWLPIVRKVLKEK